MFKTNDKNIPQIKAVIKKYGECWFHGCGNIYIDKQASDFRQNFTNPNSEESIYRIHFTNISQVPTDTEQLNKLLMSSRNKEMIEAKMNKVSHSVSTIEVEEEAEIEGPQEKTAEELEFERLLAEEKANKGK